MDQERAFTELEQRIAKEEQRRARPSQEELLAAVERAILRASEQAGRSGGGGEVKALCEARSMLLGPLPLFAGGGVVGNFTRIEKGEEVLQSGVSPRGLHLLRESIAENLNMPKGTDWGGLHTRMRELARAEVEECTVAAQERVKMRKEAARALGLLETSDWSQLLVRMASLAKDAAEERSAVVALHHQHLNAVSHILRLPGAPTWDDCLKRIRELAGPDLPEVA